MLRVLNVGGNSKDIPLPPQYANFDHWLLDIDPAGTPDIVLDARDMMLLDGDIFDAVYCSHNLEHYFYHDVHKVLKGFLHVLKDGGFAHIRVPDMGAIMRTLVQREMDIEDVLYISPSGPITILDTIYGFRKQIEESGQDFYAHKTGFTVKSLQTILYRNGFSRVYTGAMDFEISAIAFKGDPGQLGKQMFALPEE